MFHGFAQMDHELQETVGLFSVAESAMLRIDGDDAAFGKALRSVFPINQLIPGNLMDFSMPVVGHKYQGDLFGCRCLAGQEGCPPGADKERTPSGL